MRVWGWRPEYECPAGNPNGPNHLLSNCTSALPQLRKMHLFLLIAFVTVLFV